MTVHLPRISRGAVLREPAEPHRTSTPLELLFDLCFVVAVAQVSSELHHGIVAGDAGATVVSSIVVFIAVWWAWVNFTWFASAHDGDDVTYRLLTLVQMSGVLVLAAGVHEAVVDDDFAVAVIGYVVMRLALVAQWLRVARDHHTERPRALRYAAGIATVQVFWVARLALPEGGGLAVFAVLMLAEMWVPWSAEHHGTMRFHPEHVVERYGLFTIIVLGESILSATVAVDAGVEAGGVTFDVLVIAVGALVSAFAAWWVYFARPGRPDLERPWRSFLWGYGHLPVFAGLAAFGAGIQVAAEAVVHPEEVSARAAALTVTLSIAAALLGLVMINAADVRRGEAATVGVMAGSVVVLVVIGLTASATLAVVVTAAVLAILVAWKVTRYGAPSLASAEEMAARG